MANEIGDTQASVSYPELWQAETLKARYAKSVVTKWVYHADEIVDKPGDTVNVDIMPSVSVNDVGSGGSVTNQQLSLTQVQVVVDKWKEATVDITDKAVRQSIHDLIKDFSGAFGDAIAQQQDTDVLGLYSQLTTTAIGDTNSPTPMDDEMVRAAMFVLEDANILTDENWDMVRWFLRTRAELDLLGLARFSEAQNTGFAKGVQVDKGRLVGLYGIAVSKTSLVTRTGTPAVYKNLLLHKEAFAVATQKNFEIQRLAKTKLSTPINGNILYGVKCVRTDHGIVVNSAAA
jgi:hypothetical protein